MNYKPFEERPVNTAFHDLLQRIVTEGKIVPTQFAAPATPAEFAEQISQESESPYGLTIAEWRRKKETEPSFPEPAKEDAVRLIGHQVHFDLRDGFPLVLERKLWSEWNRDKSGRPPVFYQAIGELCAFLNGARHLDELERYHCFWWRDGFVTDEKCRKRGLEPGDLGPGSYGAAWTAFPTAEGESFDQIGVIFQQMKEAPHLRTHFISPWIPQYTARVRGRQQKVIVVPCHGWVHFFINPATKTVSLHLFQRSADLLVGFVANLVQYGTFLLAAAHVLGYEPEELVATISDAHVYWGQLPDLEEILALPAGKLPTVAVKPDAPQEIKAFRPWHFEVADYQPTGRRRRIWTPA